MAAYHDSSYECMGQAFGSAFEAAEYVWTHRDLLGGLGHAAEVAVTRRMDREFDTPSDLWWYAHHRGPGTFEGLPVSLLAQTLAEEPEVFGRYGLYEVGGCRCPV